MRRYVVLGVLLGGLAMLLLLLLMPSTGDFRPDNPLWNGLSSFTARFGARVARSPGELRRSLRPGLTVLVIVGPDRPLLPEELDVVSQFVRKGGTLLLMDDFGSGNELLEQLGLPAMIEGHLLCDPLFKEKSSRIPLAVNVVPDPLTQNVSSLCLNYATVLRPRIGKVLVMSSEYSFLDVNVNGVPDEGEGEGPFPVASIVRVEGGYVVVVSDSSIAINSMLDVHGNAAFLANVIGKRIPVVYIGVWRKTLLESLREGLREGAGFLRPLEVRAAVAAVVAILSLRLYGWKRSERGVGS